jgi:hypothetical protein
VIRSLFVLLLMLGGVLLGALWLARGLEPAALREALPRLHTVDLNDLVDSALEVARQRVPAPAAPPAEESVPAPVAPPPEERVPAPGPFVEAPLPEPDATDPEAGGDAPEPDSLGVAARDQDAWAALIRRLLELQRRAGLP